ncbi:hypothetical protein XH92_01640 [Bradyrhizobium sp. CCBAU 53421]|nr:hypothetical protein XH92_01640 [Bradyrhizobium sp. CCBAU 53421]
MTLPLTSPRLRGEVGLHRRCNPGEGVQVSPRSELAETAPHPNPLPARTGRGSITARASTIAGREIRATLAS